MPPDPGQSSKLKIAYSGSVIRCLILIVCLLPVCCRPTLARAAASLVIGSADSYPLGKTTLEVLADPGQHLSINDVVSPRYAGYFRAATADTPNFGMTTTAYWFRFSIDFGTRGHEKWLLLLDQPLMDYADLYLSRPDGTFFVQHSGDKRPFGSRTIPRRNILFGFPDGAGKVICYLRGQIDGRSQFPLSVTTDVALERTESAQNSIYALFLGFALTIAVISLALFRFIRETSFVYYALYILATAAYHLTSAGYLYSTILPRHPLIHDYAVQLIGFLRLFSVVVFVRAFLDAPLHAPVMDRVLRLLIRGNGILLLAVFWLPTVTFKAALMLDALITVPVLIAASIEAIRNGYSPAKYLLTARVLHESSVFLRMLMNFNLIPYSPHYATAVLITPLLDGILIAFAQGERFKLLNKQIRGLVSDLQLQVTERTAAHAALQEEMFERQRLEHEVARISDNERLRLGHDLHDGLCQQLGAARLHCAMIEEDLVAGQQNITGVRTLGTILQDAVRDAYAISKGLSPLDLDPESLSAALQRLAATVESGSGITCRFYHDGTIILSDREQVLHLYRIAQEALVNAVKHAGPSLVEIAVHHRNGLLRLSVTDNGSGLVQHTEPSPGGMGMRIMAYRARMIGGELLIDNIPGGGTAVICTVYTAPQQETP